MSGFNQILQNSFIRLIGFLQRIGNGVKGFFGVLGQLFGRLATLLGISNSGEFLDVEEARGLESAKPQQIEAKQEIRSPATAKPSRRPDPNMDYFRNMARDIQASD